jgi:hypothetical protein
MMRVKQQFSIWCFAASLILSACARPANQPTVNSSPAKQLSDRTLPTAVPLRVSGADADAAEPAIATSQDGTAFIVWVEHVETEANVLLCHLADEGQSAGTPVRVNSKPGVATAWRGDQPTVAVAPDGTIYVGWTGREDAGVGHAKHTSDIYLSASRDGGKSFEAPVKVNDDKKPAAHGMHALAVDVNGRIHLAWLDERNITKPHSSMKAEGHHMESNREVYATFSVDSGRTFASNKRVATNACPCCKTALVVGPEGRVYLSWRQVLPGDFRHIAVSSSADEGRTFSPGVVVSDDRWALKGCPVSGSSLSIGAEGSLRVVWFSAGERGEPGLYQSESRDAGLTFSPRQLVFASQPHGTPVLISGRAIWEGDENGQPKVMSAVLSQEAPAPANQIIVGEGQLPAAATSGERILLAYIATTGERRSVFVVARKMT